MFQYSIFNLFKCCIVGSVVGLTAIAPVLFEVGVQDNLILWQREIVVLLRHVLCLGGLRTSYFLVAGRMLLHVFHEDMPAFQVEPTMTFEHEFQTTLLTQPLAELLLGKTAQFQRRTVRRRLLDVQIRTPVSTLAHLVDGIVGGSRWTVEFVLSLSLDEQYFGITDDGGVGGLSGRITA